MKVSIDSTARTLLFSEYFVHFLLVRKFTGGQRDGGGGLVMSNLW